MAESLIQGLVVHFGVDCLEHGLDGVGEAFYLELKLLTSVTLGASDLILV